jgi:hypothetical protein
MKMDGEIRVKTEGKYGSLYNDLKNLVVGDFHEIFFVCACLGIKNQKSKALGKDKEDRFWSKTINPREWACYYAAVLEENNMDFNAIQDDKREITRIEEYANAGMELLIDCFLKDYLLQNSNGFQLDSGVSQEISKEFLHFIFDQVELTTQTINS